MSSESLHAPRERLARMTLTSHHAIVSLKEELDAVDWYRQRADDCEDEALKAILLHNMREEMEHAAMVIEWLRRNDPEWSLQLETYLFTEAPITEVEETETEGKGPLKAAVEEQAAPPAHDDAEPAGPGQSKFTIGAMKGE